MLLSYWFWGGLWSLHEHWGTHSSSHYRHTSNIRRNLLVNKLVDLSDVTLLPPLQLHFRLKPLASINWAKTTTRRDEIHFKFLDLLCLILDVSRYLAISEATLTDMDDVSHKYPMNICICVYDMNKFMIMAILHFCWPFPSSTCLPEIGIKCTDKLLHSTIYVGCNYLSLLWGMHLQKVWHE